MLILPVLAAWHGAHSLHPLILPAVMVLASLVGYFFCAADKRRALKNQWRIPESTLHIIELLGGWPGSYIAQRRFRHKTAKISYQIAFWSIVAAHEALALSSLNDWNLFL